jgi:hypothetical protein
MFCDSLAAPQIGKDYFLASLGFSLAQGAICRQLRLSPRFSMPAGWKVTLGRQDVRKMNASENQFSLTRARVRGRARATATPFLWIPSIISLRR